MQTPPSAPPRPITPIWRPDLTRLPPLTWPRRLLRSSLRRLATALVRGLMRPGFHGMQNLPKSGPALIATNHLGDADVALHEAAKQIMRAIAGLLPRDERGAYAVRGTD